MSEFSQKNAKCIITLLKQFLKKDLKIVFIYISILKKYENNNYFNR